jgi:hypothetical protein
MSLKLRLVALALLGSSVLGERTPIKAEGCTWVEPSPPYYGVVCEGGSCIDCQDIASQSPGCTLLDCFPYEAGVACSFQCYG